MRTGTRVRLPPAVMRPFDVYVNGVAQQEGVDYQVSDDTLVFTRELHQEGRLGFWRWASIVFGAAGTYRPNEVIDVAYEAGGRRAVASDLKLEP
jgi:hypothetical protein